MLPYLFILFAFLFRFIPSHPLGFTPVAAALLFFGARGSAAVLDSVALDGRFGCNSHQVRLCVPVYMGPLCDVRLVRGSLIVGNESSRECETSPRDRRSTSQFGFLFPAEQFRCLGIVARPLSQDRGGINNVLCRRRAVLSPRRRGEICSLPQ